VSRRTFAVGRVTPRTREIQYVEPRPAPLPGPWALKAVVREGTRAARLHLLVR
jgi:hypothetical protein